MPRKKKRILDNIKEGSCISFSPAFRNSIAECLSQAPKGFYLLLANSQEQTAKWRMEKNIYGCVGQILDAYFSGEAPPDFDGMPKNERDLIELQAWRFLSFYSMVSANWQSVWNAIKDLACPAIPIMTERHGSLVEGNLEPKSVTARFSIPECNFLELDTPAKVLIKAIEYSAIRQMDFYFGQLSKRVETNYSKRKLIADVEKSRRERASPLLIEAVEKELGSRWKSDPCSHLETICFLACYENANKGRARETTRAYLRAGYERELFERKELHPQTKLRGLPKIF